MMIASTFSFPLARRSLRRGLAGLLLAAAGTLLWQGAARSEDAIAIAPPAQDEAPGNGPLEKTVLAGGCFWGVQGVFQHVQGVQRVVSGYAGGAAETAHYETVGSGRTGHAESVEVTYDPSLISYGTLLQVFFSVACDPTELNYQGPDHGTQYRSALFVKTPGQKSVATAYLAALTTAKVFSAKIVTEVTPFTAFWPAEDYHQHLLVNNPT